MVRVNDRGNEIKRSFHPMTDRYAFDLVYYAASKGWRQWDTKQDASYFGIWVHPEKMEIVTYCEGDIDRVCCISMESFTAELKYMAEFYGSAPPSWIIIEGTVDGMVRKEYFTERYMGESHD